MPAPVLVVHDDTDTCDLAVGTLRASGLEAIGFSDPMAALDAIETYPSIRVLVTRINFGHGKLNGVALARMLSFKRRGLKTVFIAQPKYERFAEGVGEFLVMPLNHYHLVDVVGRLLSSRDQEMAVSPS
jgi:DNA-binding NtrC family response regulator